MISTLSVVLFSWQAAQLPSPVILNVPDARISQAFERAKRELLDARGADAGIMSLARTAIGVPPAAGERMSLPALHSYWNTTADSAGVRQRWPDLRTAFVSGADTAMDAGVWLATLDGAIGISRALKDPQTDSIARSFYASAEARLTQRVSLYGLAFGLYPDTIGEALLMNLLPSMRAYWPIGNGLAALAFYAYHQDSTAFAIVDSMAQTNNFTAPMFVLPVIRGLIGWETDAANRAAAFEPHMPAAWTSLNISNLPIGNDRVDTTIRRDENTYTIHLQRQFPGRQLSLRIAPALPLGARVRHIKVNERDVPIHVELTAHDVHAVIELMLLREANIEIEFEPPRKSLLR